MEALCEEVFIIGHIVV